MDEKELAKLQALDNSYLIDFISTYVELCNPDSVFVRTDSADDVSYIRNRSVSLGEEQKLALDGQTIHFDGGSDQARDKKNTKYLLKAGQDLGKHINSTDREKGLVEITGYLRAIMKGKQMYVCFFCLGPLDSEFSILAVQITDSAYVSHSEDILYRPGYEQFKKNKGVKEFFKFVHSAGQLDGTISKNIDKRRVYIDLEDKKVYSVNTQYAGNTVGLKKLALRLAINKASREGWLAEHMFVMGIDDEKGEKFYFCGAYPSMCGKTSTAMLKGEAIIGDDIAYLRKREGEVFAVNVERGIFGIIKDVNSKDDAILFKILNGANEVIFSNILIDEAGVPYWIGKDGLLPHKGTNYSGSWVPGKTDVSGQEIPPSHKNARYTIRLKSLENLDANLENPAGVVVKGLIYGGRDSDTSVPVEASFSWQHGIITKAAILESETTAATLGQEGVRVFNPMSNIDFLSITMAKYIEMNLDFAKGLTQAPLIFSVNYFLGDKDGKFLNRMQDKRVWLKWIRLMADGQVGALKAATGLIPKYDDLRKLFEDVLGKGYTEADYVTQFTLRIPQNLAKIERVRNIYKEAKGISRILFDELDAQEVRLKEFQKQFGDYVSPLKLT